MKISTDPSDAWHHTGGSQGTASSQYPQTLHNTSIKYSAIQTVQSVSPKYCSCSARIFKFGGDMKVMIRIIEARSSVGSLGLVYTRMVFLLDL